MRFRCISSEWEKSNSTSVETCASLSLESRLLSFSRQHPALILRISLAHMCSYFSLQESRACAPRASACPCIRAPTRLTLIVHPSIHSPLVSIGEFSCYSLYLTYLQNILHAPVLSMAVGPLLHIFTVIFSLLGSRLWSCALSSA
jgi:hypothetical protein